MISSKIVPTIRSTSRRTRCGFSSAIFWISSDRIIAPPSQCTARGLGPGDRLLILSENAAAMIGLVLIQHGKGADMGASFGSGASGSLFGATGSSNFMSKATALAAATRTLRPCWRAEARLPALPGPYRVPLGRCPAVPPPLFRWPGGCASGGKAAGPATRKGNPS